MSDSKKVLIEKIIVAALLVVLGGVFFYMNMRKRGPANLATLSAEEHPIIDIAAAKDRLAAMAIRQEALYAKEAVRDPLKLPPEVTSIDISGPTSDKAAKTGEEGSDKYVLEGLMVNDRENLAIISGSVVGVGEILNGAKVVSIDKTGVVLSKSGSKIELKR